MRDGWHLRSCADAQNPRQRSALLPHGKRWDASRYPLATGRVVYEMAVVLTREERHFELPVRRVLGTDKESKAEGAD